MSHEFSEPSKRGVYEAIARRRDVRQFRADPISDEVLARILMAAHQAGSVGFMQPWNFLVIEDRSVRREIRAHVELERKKAADSFDGDRKETYLSLKLEGILDSPLNICVTCDPTRHGPAVIGRNTIKETDAYSTCCAVQNLWLAARAEGIGVGWVSILQPVLLRELLGIPDHVIPVAYLCLGYVDKFPDQPLFEEIGWLPRLPLTKIVFLDSWEKSPHDSLLQSLDAASDPAGKK